jgi:hypothetical protein
MTRRSRARASVAREKLSKSAGLICGVFIGFIPSIQQRVEDSAELDALPPSVIKDPILRGCVRRINTTLVLSLFAYIANEKEHSKHKE